MFNHDELFQKLSAKLKKFFKKQLKQNYSDLI